MLRIPRSILEQIVAHARETAPVEACGLLAGRDQDVTRLFRMTNVDQATDHFTLDPVEQFAVIKQCRAAGSKIIAVYHSHPTSPARPSPEDIRLAFDPSIDYVIVSLVPSPASGEGIAKVFRIRDGVVSDVPLEITEDLSGNFYAIPETLGQEIDALEQLIRDRIDGRLDAASLKARRVPFGVYEQRRKDSYMMRVRTPGGILTPSQLRAIAEASRRWGASFIHVTTRQEFQMHDLALESLIPAMRMLVGHGLATRGGGGNTVRNIVSSLDAGVDPDEVFDVTPYAAALTSRFIAEFSSWALPRKFKLSFSNSARDTALAWFTDVGFIASERDGVHGFKVILAGGMGAVSMVGLQAHDFIPLDDVYVVARAARNFFDQKGNRRNKHRARFRFLRKDLGDERFLAAYRAELEAVRGENPAPLQPEFDKFENKAAEPDLVPLKSDSPEFKLWQRRFAFPQKQPGLYSVLIPIRLGKFPVDAAIRLADFIAPFGANVLRATREQNLKLRNIPEEFLGNVFEVARAVTEFASKPRLLGQAISCAGADTCQLGICLARGAVDAITDRLAASNRRASDLDLDRLGDFRLNVSGCPNACGQHVVADLGFFGRTFHENGRYYPAYAVVTGGVVADGQAALARHIGDIPAKNLPEFTADYLGGVLDGADDAKLAELIARHQPAPTFESAPDFYRDWGAAEPFTLAGRGVGECSAGLFDLIEIDLKNARARRKDLLEGRDADEIYYDLARSTARMLLISRGVDAGTDNEVFDGFLKFFIESGLVDGRFSPVIVAARTRDVASLRRLRNDLEGLADAVEKLYEDMDNSLRFPAERPASPDHPSTSDQAPETQAPETQAPETFRDYRGVACPINFVKVKLDLSRMKTGERLKVFLDDGDPIKNVPRSAEGEGHKVVAQNHEGPHWSVTIEKG